MLFFLICLYHEKCAGASEEKPPGLFFGSLIKDGVPSYYLPHLLDKLKFLYAQGIVEAEDYDVLKKENIRQVWLYENNESQPRYVKQLFTEKTAYKYMMTEEDSVRFNHGKLMRCGLCRGGAGSASGSEPGTRFPLR